MKFKTTMRKLRLVLVVLAALTFYLSVTVFFPMKEHRPIFMLAIIGMILTLTHLYLGVSLKRLMAKHSRTVPLMLLLSVCWLIVSFVVTVRAPVDTMMTTASIIGVVLAWYAMRVHKQLGALPAAEPQPAPAAATAAAK